MGHFVSRTRDGVEASARNGAPLIRDRRRLERSRVSSASLRAGALRAALRPGHESDLRCAGTRTDAKSLTLFGFPTRGRFARFGEVAG
jgi:hypothetical protein